MPRSRGQILRVVALAGLLPLAGCIAHAPGSGGGNQHTTVTVSPASATVSGANTQQFTATVTGPQITAVTWDVNGVQGGNLTVGTIDGTGLYTAPITVPTPNTASVTAIAAANGTTSAPSTVTISPSQVSVTVAPSTATVALNTTQQFTATVKGTTNTAVSWFVNSVQGGNLTYGTIDSTGLYTAPATVPSNTSVTITATSQANNSASGNATASITGITVSVSPGPAVSLPVSGTQQFSATLTGTSNQNVTWSVAPYSACPAANAGTISATGLYTAPATIPQPTGGTGPCSMVITATSQANNTFSASVIANVHITVSINTAPSQIGLGANWQFTATVTGADPSNPDATALHWTAFSQQAHAGTFDQDTGFYTAPSTSPLPNTPTITATSVFDPSQNPSVPLTLVQNDPLGSVSNVKQLNSCSGSLQNGRCVQMDVSCPGVADITAYLKILTPSATPVGTVLFGVGTGGSGLYDDPTASGYNYGGTVIQDILNANYNTVQVSFGAPFTSNQPNGWLQGPGGVRRLACRYATIADWVYRNPTLINPNATNTTNSAPMCATGNSGGSGAIAYAVYEYGLGSEFAMIEPTSGPPMARLDLGCSPCSQSSTGQVCSTTNAAEMCYSPADASIIDAAYQNAGATTPTLCSDALNGKTVTDGSAIFISDSILSTQANPSLTNTKVNIAFGNLDPTNAVAQGMTWGQSVVPKLASSQLECLAGVDHDIPNFAPANPPLSSGQQQIAYDIINNCK